MEPNTDAGVTDVSSATPFLLFSLIGEAHHSFWKRIKKNSLQDKEYIYTSPQRITVQNL